MYAFSYRFFMIQILADVVFKNMIITLISVIIFI